MPRSGGHQIPKIKTRSRSGGHQIPKIKERRATPTRRGRQEGECVRETNNDAPEVTQIIGYCLGLCLSRYSVQLHAACFMSNHYHLDVTDVEGELPAFKCMLNALIARSLNCHRGRFDKFWSKDRACDVEVLNDEDVLSRMAYTESNAVSAMLV